MDRLYDRSFKLGFVFTILAFVVLNIGSYLNARNQYEATLVSLEGNLFSGSPDFPKWGFPFSWYGNRWAVFEDGVLGLVFNFSAIISCAFVAGLLLKFISAKLRTRIN